MFRITRAWIHEHKTARGGWTMAQVKALGLPWPLTAGWITDIDGTEVPDEVRAAFESAAQTFRPKTLKHLHAPRIVADTFTWNEMQAKVAGPAQSLTADSDRAMMRRQLAEGQAYQARRAAQGLPPCPLTYRYLVDLQDALKK